MPSDHSIRPSPGRIVAIILLGPIIGSIAVFIVPFIVDPPADDGAMAIRFLPFLFFFGYLFGLLPSAMAGFAYSRLYARLGSGWLRWLQCALIGGLCGAIFTHPLVWMFAGGPVFEPPMLVMGGIAGAFALPLTALTFRGKS
jgi:hypothetical protein